MIEYLFYLFFGDFDNWVKFVISAFGSLTSRVREHMLVILATPKVRDGGSQIQGSLSNIKDPYLEKKFYK